MNIRSFLFTVAALLFLFIYSCKKNEVPPYPSLTTYYPLTVGTSLTYRLDSLVPANFSVSLVTHSYHLKDSIESTFNDNTGRLSYRVYRYITDTNEAQPWAYLSTYFITPTATTIQVVDDNNYRFIKLAAPVVSGYSWQGNTYIDTKSINSPVSFMDGWSYTYQYLNEPFTVPAGVIDSTVTVYQDTANTPNIPFSTSLTFYEHIYAKEVYAKNIGLIYKEFTHWIWQINPQAAYEDNSYGIKLSLIRIN